MNDREKPACPKCGGEGSVCSLSGKSPCFHMREAVAGGNVPTDHDFVPCSCQPIPEGMGESWLTDELVKLCRESGWGIGDLVDEIFERQAEKFRKGNE